MSVFSGCNYDQVTTEYETYQQAVKDDFFSKGWIPYELQDSSITNIYVRANLDVNNYIFSFSTKKEFQNMPPMALNQINKPLNIHGIEIPEWWNIEIQNKPRTTILLSSHGSEYINIVLDEDNGRIYGWNEKSR